jgi:DNA-directed RNA polymerase specialized sigma24 family protein
MALKQGNGLQGWEIAVTKKLIGEFRRRSRSLYREEFDDLLQECLMHWLEVRQQLVPDPGGPPIAYMARVVRNKLIDLARAKPMCRSSSTWAKPSSSTGAKSGW